MKINALIVVLLLFATSAQAGIKEATVRIDNGGKGGSGTIVRIHGDLAYGLTCAHLFIGRIEGHFVGVTHDGKQLDCVLKDFDRTIDVAVFVCPPVEGLDWIPIATDIPQGKDCTLAGYPFGSYLETSAVLGKNYERNEFGKDRYRFDSVQPVTLGASGGGAFCQGQLIGIIHSVATADNRIVSTATQGQVKLFAAKERKHCINNACQILDFFVPKVRRPAPPRAPYVPPPPVKEPPASEPPPPPKETTPDKTAALEKRIADLEKALGAVKPGASPEEVEALKAKIATLENLKIPVRVYNPDGSVSTQKTYPLLKFGEKQAIEFTKPVLPAPVAK